MPLLERTKFISHLVPKVAGKHTHRGILKASDDLTQAHSLDLSLLVSQWLPFFGLLSCLSIQIASVRQLDKWPPHAQ